MNWRVPKSRERCLSPVYSTAMRWGYTSLADYVQEVTEDSMTIPQSLHYYIDWQAMARDAEMNGYLFTISTAYNEVHVFAGG